MKIIAFLFLVASATASQAEDFPTSRSVETSLEPGEIRCVVSNGTPGAESLVSKGPGFVIWEEADVKALEDCEKRAKMLQSDDAELRKQAAQEAVEKGQMKSRRDRN